MTLRSEEDLILYGLLRIRGMDIQSTWTIVKQYRAGLLSVAMRIADKNELYIMVTHKGEYAACIFNCYTSGSIQ